MTIAEGQRLTAHEAATPIISLATIEKQERARLLLDERTELNSETEQIQQILTIVESLRRQPSPLDEHHLIAELHRIFRVFDGRSILSATPAIVDDETGATTPVGIVQQGASPLAGPERTKEANRLLSVTVARNVLTWARQHLAAQAERAKEAALLRRESDDDGLEGLVLSLAAALNQAEQTELHSILQGLPPSVLGDEGAQEETRVFLDIKKDIREAQKLEGSKVERRQQLVEVVTGVVVELIQTLSPTLVCDSKGKEKDENNTEGSAARVVASLLSCVDEQDRLRLVMEQLLLASGKWLPRDHERRDERLRAVFRRSQCDDTAPQPTLEALVILP